MKRIEKLIFEQADRSPDSVAVEYQGTRLSYAELKQQSLQIGRALRKSGLEPGEAVGIFQHRSLNTVPLLLGIWDAGGIVVPINPNTPAQMLAWMTQNSSTRIIVTEPSLRSKIVNAGEHLNSAPLILAGNWRSNGHSAKNSNQLPDSSQISIKEEDLKDDCYVIYTSGSEGRPKGVRGSHDSLIQYLKWQAKEFSVTTADRFSQTAPLSFDFSLKELLVPLICGACVCIADRSTVIDPRKFLGWIVDNKITVMCCVPTLLRSILQLPDHSSNDRVPQSLRSVLISGDMLRWNDVISWRERFGNSTSLFNLYGPTESTIIKLFYPIPEATCPESVNVPVGKAIEDADVLILDENDRPCRPGEIGEIVILSEWLARGYVQDGRASDRSFCRLIHKGKRTSAYRTGDLGRWLSSGNVELTGRKDRQVKIRGYRIELGEIESILSEHPAIRDVAVVVVNESEVEENPPEIVCYFSVLNSAVAQKEILNYARERLLPQVLSLTRFVCLDQLPLSANGKVDRLKLNAAADRGGNRFLSQSTQSSALLTVEQRIQVMWEELLAVDGIDLEANFFELGGDSMIAIRLLRRLREELHSEINLGDLYEFPSVSQLSARVEQLSTQGH